VIHLPLVAVFFWSLVDVILGMIAASWLLLRMVKRGDRERARHLLWRLGETFTLREDRPSEQRFVCTNASCPHRGAPQCPICGAHFQVHVEDAEEGDEDFSDEALTELAARGLDVEELRSRCQERRASRQDA
jgi:hypothetical protein